ncbi:MAG TPA: hypothetical protein VFJ93_04825 [Gaiellaceae bacterium]|nr:hypothetical protein [Gaiellaceae bacterium]
MNAKLLAPMRSWEARRALRGARRRADEELAATRLPPPRLAWRAAELVADENRIDLARSLTDVVHAADERLLPAASPIDRVAVRECRPQLLAIAARLFEVSKPVSPRAVLLVERLLTNGSGALYGLGDAGRLLAAATHIIGVLDGE